MKTNNDNSGADGREVLSRPIPKTLSVVSSGTALKVAGMALRSDEPSYCASGPAPVGAIWLNVLSISAVRPLICSIRGAATFGVTFGVTLAVEGIQICVFELKMGSMLRFVTFATFFGPICQLIAIS